MGYDIINTIELVKNLDVSEGDIEYHTIELLSENFRIYKWKKDIFDGGEMEFMRLLEKFYAVGGK